MNKRRKYNLTYRLKKKGVCIDGRKREVTLPNQTTPYIKSRTNELCKKFGFIIPQYIDFEQKIVIV